MITTAAPAGVRLAVAEFLARLRVPCLADLAAADLAADGDDQKDEPEPDHPNTWAPGLVARIKTLNTRTVTRAKTPAEVLPTAAAHNLRSGNEGHRHRHTIDSDRTPLNTVLRGPERAAVACELAENILAELGIDLGKVSRVAITGIELVVQCPDGWDVPAFWACVLDWADAEYQHIVSAVVHRDQRRPHIHVLAMAVKDGRLAGDVMTGGNNRARYRVNALYDHVRAALHIRPSRPDPVAKLALKAGKGAKTHAAAARRDAELERLASLGVKVGEGNEVNLGEGIAEEVGEGIGADESPRPDALPSLRVTDPPSTTCPATSVTTPADADREAENDHLRAEVARQRDAAGPASTTCSTPDRLVHLAVMFARARTPMSPCPTAITDGWGDAREVTEEPAPPPAQKTKAKRTRTVSLDKMSHNDLTLLRVLADAPWLTTIGITYRRHPGLTSGAAVLATLQAMQAVGLVESRPSGKTSRWGSPILRWATSPAGRALLPLRA